MRLPTPRVGGPSAEAFKASLELSEFALMVLGDLSSEHSSVPKTRQIIDLIPGTRHPGMGGEHPSSEALRNEYTFRIAM